ncbi:nucleic acid-binding protein [Glonium stellatum]|uniref:Nucleic acid-binding protein n=1 Tax=Glonium stellatum TaxID=574774 RepID=A0A8E2EM56_9PEZI|nr:nucleic acid-binding protein [Glonium stellatum]
MASPLASRQLTGVVVSAGKMAKTVKVRIAKQEWHKHIRKFFPSSTTYLVSDPNSSLHEGDVVRIASGWRTSRHIRHVVSSIIAPFGTPINARPPIPTEEERIAERQRRRLAKDVRQAERGRVPSQLRIAEAIKQGREVPDLETATRNLRKEVDDTEKVKRAAGVLSGKERRRQERDQTDIERNDALS